MGISLDAWRLRIGCFAQRKIRAAPSGNLPKLQKAISDELGGCILLVIMMMMSLLLFLSGDVEMNPGPPMYQPEHSVKKQPRKTEASRAQQQQGTGLRESILKGEKYMEKGCWREATDVFNKLIYCVPPLGDPSLTCRLFCNRARCHLSQGFVLLAVKDVHSVR
ncbi:uncharacterized protein LOC106167800 isoform X2 [Lingula anatina]|uniref:Uncharacterized protein LOC106167800 isoform X2 n=1 Tax=Lingula anatina TaxID=7574 RepID=A0A1S3IVA2_LINAN|nr:uncharacterized protein LOC106167800 isoform X2 [Lingula anatina]|eukprot:XP_013402127.1 uncharacterized protein LOC106167800 isoform X2 [Lingula anatina]